MTKSDVYVYPTDTVWGIGAPMSSEAGQRQVAEVKKTGPGKPLSLLFLSLAQFREFFDLPQGFSKDFLTRFFSLETTLLIPKSWRRKDIPLWITAESSYVGCRCLPDFKNALPLQEPVTTTSFNLTGSSPCVTKQEAYELWESLEIKAQFIDSSDVLPSGRSSTIVKFDSFGEWEIVRKGDRWQSVKALLS